MAEPWQSGYPPRDTIVEVKLRGRIRRVIAVYHSFGAMLFWKLPDESEWFKYKRQPWRREKTETQTQTTSAPEIDAPAENA